MTRDSFLGNACNHIFQPRWGGAVVCALCGIDSQDAAMPEFAEIQRGAREEKCPGGGFSSEGHHARKGTARFVDADMLEVFCEKCRKPVTLYVYSETPDPKGYGI